MKRESTGISSTERSLGEELKASSVEGRLPCAVAFKISKKLKVSPREVGDMANKLKIKISKCQLGCFQ
jgi:LAO/AO transport system kinase